MDAYDNKVEQVEENIQKLYSLLWGQCTQAMQAEIKGDDEFNDKSSENNALWLIEKIKKVMSGVKNGGNLAKEYFDQFEAVKFTKQTAQEPMESYLKRFNGICTTLKLTQSDNIWKNKKIFRGPFKGDGKAAEKVAMETVQAMFFIQHSDKVRFASKIRELNEALDVGRDEIPRQLLEPIICY